jgi:hypothetical protein
MGIVSRNTGGFGAADTAAEVFGRIFLLAGRARVPLSR